MKRYKLYLVLGGLTKKIIAWNLDVTKVQGEKEGEKLKFFVLDITLC